MSSNSAIVSRPILKEWLRSCMLSSLSRGWQKSFDHCFTSKYEAIASARSVGATYSPFKLFMCIKRGCRSFLNPLNTFQCSFWLGSSPTESISAFFYILLIPCLHSGKILDLVGRQDSSLIKKGEFLVFPQIFPRFQQKGLLCAFGFYERSDSAAMFHVYSSMSESVHPRGRTLTAF